MASADILRAAHSLLPWQVHRSSVTGGINVVYEPNGFGRTVVLTGFALGSGKIAEANTEFVYRACNAHYQLLEALKHALADIEHGGSESIPVIRAAIAAAEREAGHHVDNAHASKSTRRGSSKPATLPAPRHAKRRFGGGQ